MRKPKPGYKFVNWHFGKYLEIPDKWTMVKFGEIVDDAHLGTNQVGIVGGIGIPLLKMGNLTYGGFNYKKLEKIQPDTVENIDKYLLQKNDFLFNTRNTDVLVGKCAVWKNDFLQAIFNNNLMRIYFSKFIENSDYVSYFLNSHIGRRSLRRLVDATTSVAAIYYGSLKLLKLPVPSLLEQQKIASILSTVDELINHYDKVIEKTNHLKTGLMQKLLTKGIGHRKFKKINIGFGITLHIPEEWKVKKLKENTSKIGSGITPLGGSEIYQKKGIPLIRSQNVHFSGLRLHDVVYISKEIHKKMSGSSLHSKDVLLNITGASIGRCNIVPDGFGEGNVNQHVCIIRPKLNLDSSFLNYFLASNLMQNIINSAQGGLSRQGLNFKDLGNFLIFIPSKNEQQKIASILNKIDDKLSDLESKKTSLEKVKKGLMQKLLTGQIRVKV